MPTIRKADEAMLVKFLIVLIYGDASSGKTTLSGTSKRALIFDGDRGAYRALHRPDTLEVQSWQDILDVVADDVIMSGYDTIVLDTVGTVLDFLAERIAKLPGKNSNGAGGLSPQGWGLLKNEFQAFVNNLRAKGKNIVFVAHAKEEKDGENRYYRPDIQGGSKDMVYRICDSIGYAYRTSANTRIVDFSCVERAMVKDTANIGKLTIPDLTEKQPFFEEVMERMLDGINNKTEAQQQAVSTINNFRKTAETLTEAEQFNEQIAVITALKETNKAVAMQCYKILEERAAQHGLEFDKEAKKYFAANAKKLTKLQKRIKEFDDKTTADDFNAALADARAVAKENASDGKKLKALLDEAAGHLGFEFDSKAKAYFVPQMAEAAQEEVEAPW